MSKPSNTARAIQLDKHANDLFIEGARIASRVSSPNTCAETHVAQIAERYFAQSQFVKTIANWFGKKSMDE